MKILITNDPISHNDYIESLISAYLRAGHDVATGADDFFYSSSIPDILHIHWPENLYLWHAPKGMSSDSVKRIIVERLDWYKRKGVTIINTIHNIAPHDSTGGTGREVYRQIIEHADILVHHCSNSIGLLAEIYPSVFSRANIVCPHGDYLIHYRAVNKDKARSRYNIPKDRLVILNFGRQRPYKNGQFITAVFKQLENKLKYLVIAGYFDYSNAGYWLRKRNRFREHFPYRDRKYIYRSFPIAEIPDIISSADIIFLGQQHALNSGVLSLAATYSKPVVCPDIGCFKQSLNGWHYQTFTAGDIKGARHALQTMCDNLQDLATLDNSDWLRKNSWERHVNGILKAVTNRMDS